ncbi:MAG TPA: transporter, partial [Paludibacter sp.]
VGYLLVVSIVIMVIARFTPFHKTLKIAIPKTGEDMV